MKRVILIIAILFTVNLFAQTEINDVTGAGKNDILKTSLQQQYNKLVQEAKSKIEPLEAVAYRARKTFEATEKEIVRLEDEYNKKLAEIQQKFQAILDEEKKLEKKDEKK